MKKFGSIAAEVSPELGCAGQHERAAEAPIGKVRFPSVGRCVCRSCCRSDLVEGSVSRIGLLCLGSGAGSGALGFWKPIILVRGVSALLCVWLSPGTSWVPPPGFERCPGLVPSGGSIPPPGFGFGCCCCSRATCNRPCLLCVRLWFTRRTAAARSALCAVFGVCGCGAF